eukprot:CAMPEP_0204381858 /NCGR_PEP_ID=MMETSP0469-20131031/54604_1 /ASSEMBLY_ACC=CAM_ASM_000384 /TAXON_ID=2969 /ORGANISM="Oxyrrhis marina" /LENGTH=271 /DNA_ID=CAMNT_0051373791 /DNA_START=20 /DNA_END=832 /DNA_ORIENTATION=+
MACIDFQTLLREERAKAQLKVPAIDLAWSACDLEQYRLTGVEDVWYIPEFLTPDQEQQLLQDVNGGTWVSLARRQLQNYGGVPHSKGMLPEPLPPWLAALCVRVVGEGIFPPELHPNQALVNSYRDGAGIARHKDGPLFSSRVGVVSTGSSAVLEFSEASGAVVAAVLLQPRSLLLFDGAAFSHLDHGIREVTEDIITELCVNKEMCGVSQGDVIARGPAARVSVTIRHVPHVVDVPPSAELDAEKLARFRVWCAAISEREAAPKAAVASS